MIKFKRIKNELMKGKLNVWWSPGKTHVALYYYTVTFPREWYPHKEDEYRVCPNCNRKLFMEKKSILCYDCQLVHKQIQGFINGPNWWPQDLRKVIKDWLPKTSFYGSVKPVAKSSVKQLKAAAKHVKKKVPKKGTT